MPRGEPQKERIKSLMRVDLHIHTTASDGCWSPQEVVTHVRQAGIGLFAIADHESVVNVQEAGRLAREAGLAFLPGVETSARLDEGVLHILGYGVDTSHPTLRELLRYNLGQLHGVNEENLRRIAEAGYPVDLAAYEAYEYDRARGGWKALNYLIDLGLCENVWDFLDRLYVDSLRPPMPEFPSPAEVTAAIRAAGGVAVLAHPGASLKGMNGLPAALERVLEGGIGGVECYSTYHDPETTATCLAFCERFDLLITGGSDCHGGFAGRTVGEPPVERNDLKLGELEEKIR